MRQPLPAVVLVQYVQVGPLWAACDAAEKAGLCSLLQVQESATEDEALDHVSCALLQLIDGGAAAAAALVGQVQLKQDAMATGNAANTLPPRDWLNLLHAARLPVIVQMDLIRKCVCGCEQLGGGEGGAVGVGGPPFLTRIIKCSALGLMNTCHRHRHSTPHALTLHMPNNCAGYLSWQLHDISCQTRAKALSLSWRS